MEDDYGDYMMNALTATAMKMMEVIFIYLFHHVIQMRLKPSTTRVDKEWIRLFASRSHSIFVLLLYFTL